MVPILNSIGTDCACVGVGRDPGEAPVAFTLRDADSDGSRTTISILE